MSSKLDILYVIPYFNPKFGGDVNSCYNTAREMLTRGHNVSVITSNYQFDEEYAKSLTGAQVTAFDCKLDVNFFLYSPDMKKWLERNLGSFDLSHLHTYRSYQSALVSKYSVKEKKPYVLHAHGTVTRLFQKKGFKFLFDSIYGHNLLDGASRVIALSNLEVRQYESMHVSLDRIKLIPNGVEALEAPLALHRDDFRKKFGIPVDAIVLLYVGRLHKIKGLDYLLESFSKIKDCRHHLVLVGSDGGEYQRLKNIVDTERIGHLVHFTGPLYGDEKISALISSDIYLQTSIYDAFPTSVLEACSYGLPIILTESCGCSDAIVEANAGMAVKYGDVDSLKNKIVELASDQSLRCNLGMNGKKCIQNNFNFSSSMSKIEKMYHEVVAGRGELEKIADF